MLPTETVEGILLTKMSVTTPTVALLGNSAKRMTLSDETPILWLALSPLIDVDTPETITVSLLRRVCVGMMFPDT